MSEAPREPALSQGANKVPTRSQGTSKEPREPAMNQGLCEPAMSQALCELAMS